MEIEVLSAEREGEWDAFLRSTDTALIYQSLAYRDFLLDILPNAHARYLVARQDGRLRGALPLMFSDNAAPVVNALPFYGSNGAPVMGSDDDAPAIHAALVEHALQLCAQAGARALTIVENPLDTRANAGDWAGWDLTDERIGQLKRLPEDGGGQANQQALFGAMHQKTRNLVRKGLRAGFDIELADDDEAWDALVRIHHDNIAAIGGRAKPPAVFAALRNRFAQPRQRRLYVARRDGDIAAALLMLYFNGTAEYFTPVIDVRYRSEQPLSALILHALCEAIEMGCRWWNWGGTWLGQEGVYRFKQRWGTEDRRYAYHTKLWDRDILEQTPQELLTQYPYFFVVPFSALNTTGS